MTGIWRLRAAILILVGALVLHHGRYAFATPEHAHEVVAAHAYLPWLAGASAMALFLLVVQLATHFGRAGVGDGIELPRARTLWLAATLSLLGVFGAQESAEWLLSHGRLPELADILGAGGWTAVPLAIVAGALIALLLRGAATVLQWALERRRRPIGRQAAPAPLVPRPPRLAAARSVLARRLAGRGPPALSSST
ncbi:MAG TPA: hypothetical protein VD836_10305 [Solirubrobacteraceae bacterium]|nr:hypothetical protein [Solirubrobacteraceae bacterium]